MGLLNCIPILRSHYSTLRKDSNLFLIIFWFFLIPFVLSLVPIYLNVNLNKQALINIITTFAIFVGFLINVIVLLVPIRKNETVKIRKNLANHLHYNTMYELMIGLLILTVALFGSFITFALSRILIQISSLILFFLIFHFIFNLLLIIRRVYALFEKMESAS